MCLCVFYKYLRGGLEDEGKNNREKARKGYTN